MHLRNIARIWLSSQVIFKRSIELKYIHTLTISQKDFDDGYGTAILNLFVSLFVLSH